MKKLAITLIVALLAVVMAALPVFAEINPDDIAEDAVMYTLDLDNFSVLMDFENADKIDDFTNALGDLGTIEYLSYSAPGPTRINIADGEDAISGEKSLVIDGGCDLRSWSLSLLEGDGEFVFFEFKIKVVNSTASGGFSFSVTDPSIDGTANESTGGKVIGLSFGEEKTTIKNKGSKAIAEISNGETHTIAFAFPLGEETYNVFVDGVQVSTENKWMKAPLEGVSAMRYDLSGGSKIIIDDITVAYGNTLTKEQYFATPTPTPEPTPEPTATPEATAAPEATKAPEGGNTGDDKPADDGKKGCGSVVVSSALVASMTLLAAAVVLKKKH